jgi:hypothetical protein
MHRDPLEKPAEPGAYVGREPERMAETIPDGVDPDEDERIAAHSTHREKNADTVDASLNATDNATGAQRGQSAQGGS